MKSTREILKLRYQYMQKRYRSSSKTKKFMVGSFVTGLTGLVMRIAGDKVDSNLIEYIGAGIQFLGTMGVGGGFHRLYKIKETYREKMSKLFEDRRNLK